MFQWEMYGNMVHSMAFLCELHIPWIMGIIWNHGIDVMGKWMMKIIYELLDLRILKCLTYPRCARTFNGWASKNRQLDPPFNSEWITKMIGSSSMFDTPTQWEHRPDDLAPARRVHNEPPRRSPTLHGNTSSYLLAALASNNGGKPVNPINNPNWAQFSDGSWLYKTMNRGPKWIQRWIHNPKSPGKGDQDQPDTSTHGGYPKTIDCCKTNNKCSTHIHRGYITNHT